MTKRENWEPGDVLPGVRPGVHSGPIFKLKVDHEDGCVCEQYGDWSWVGLDAMRWTADPE